MHFVPSHTKQFLFCSFLCSLWFTCAIFFPLANLLSQRNYKRNNEQQNFFFENLRISIGMQFCTQHKVNEHKRNGFCSCSCSKHLNALRICCVTSFILYFVLVFIDFIIIIIIYQTHCIKCS